MWRCAILLVLLSAAGCGEAGPVAPTTTRVEDIALSAAAPDALVPGSRIALDGASFIPDFAGVSELTLVGALDGVPVTVALPARFRNYELMDVDWPGGIAAGLPAEQGTFRGSAVLEAQSNLDGLSHTSAPLDVILEVRSSLTPELDVLQNDVAFVNDPIVAHGAGFLLGGDEGQTIAVVEGCFTQQGQTTCAAVGPVEVPAQPLIEHERERVVFPFSPYITGIRPGAFSGRVRLVNRHGDAAGGIDLESATAETACSIGEPVIIAFEPQVASLGQYVDIRGGGFVGPEGADPTFAVTTVELEGSFTPEGGSAVPTSINVIPEFVGGQLARYVLNEEDELGQAVDLRTVAGSFAGTARPVIAFGGDTVSGTPTAVTLAIGHVKQLVHLRFLPQYVESLRHFGLRAADPLVRDRVVEVIRRDYAGVNIEVRLEAPGDFALYSEVEIGGPDPNGLGLLGYDNTPGKDNGNLRLYDRIGGVNALTQLDGFPGYGGIFVESLFVFSEHPGSLAEPADTGHARFDQIFDPFRPDVGGEPVSVSELSGIPYPVDLATCPAADRPTRIACAIAVLGNLIGTTVSHEVAHALGLADPGGQEFHNAGDHPDELMDAGGDRPFLERAELDGHGPGSFCSQSYDYLRQILPTDEPDPLPTRVVCQ